MVSADAKCRCPCLPKCCPAGFALSTSSTADEDAVHGIRCVPANEGSVLELPEVPLLGRLSPSCAANRSISARFYHSVLPACEGVSGDDRWRYRVHGPGTFRLDADYMQEYVLHVRDRHVQTKVVSNFDNVGERAADLRALTVKQEGDGRAEQESVVGFKPLMHFCFDLEEEKTGGGQFQTVAVTCPRAALNNTTRVHKCCPRGKI